jgi:hypothetical protein
MHHVRTPVDEYIYIIYVEWNNNNSSHLAVENISFHTTRKKQSRSKIKTRQVHHKTPKPQQREASQTTRSLYSIANILLRFVATRLVSLPKNFIFGRAQRRHLCKMENFLPTLNSNKHHALLQESVRTCILEELAQVQRETDEQDTKYKHVATEVCFDVFYCIKRYFLIQFNVCCMFQ